MTPQTHHKKPNDTRRLYRPRVALIVETSLASGREILRGIASYVREHRPWSIYHEPRAVEDAAPDWLINWKGDGIIARVQNRQIADAVRATKLPVVDTLGLVPETGLPLVHVDDAAIATLAAEHLLGCGFTHFGFCGVDGANWSAHRGEAFEHCVTEVGYTCDQYQLRSKNAKVAWEQEQNSLVEWIRSLPKPVAILACNDPRGQRVLEACGRAGVMVPDEVAVMGVDNDDPICDVATPPMTSVQPNHRQVGYEAAALLENLLAGGQAPKAPVYLAPSGVFARQSTDVIAIEDKNVVRAVRFIRDFACDGITVEDVIAQVPVSRSVLQRRFKRILDRSIHDEIVQYRIKRAKQLLVETEIPIATIADMVGYQHTEYLGVVFKAKTAMSPGQFRRQHGK